MQEEPSPLYRLLLPLRPDLFLRHAAAAPKCHERSWQTLQYGIVCVQLIVDLFLHLLCHFSHGFPGKASAIFIHTITFPISTVSTVNVTHFFSQPAQHFAHRMFLCYFSFTVPICVYHTTLVSQTIYADALSQKNNKINLGLA